jgi:hypothetical protein
MLTPGYTEVDLWCRPAGGEKYRSIIPLRWHIGRKGSGYVYEVPAGFLFDVSIPWALRLIFSPHNPRFLKAAALHDHMRHVENWNRRTSGAVFHEALMADGVKAPTRLAMWLAVSVFRYPISSRGEAEHAR